MAWTPKFTFSVTWDNITGKPLNYPTTWSLVGGKPSTFPSTWATVSGKPETATRWPTWGEVTGKPSTFAPSSHTHTIANVTGLQTALDAKFDSPSGTTSQYIRGNGTLATFPSIPAGTVTSVSGGNGLTGTVTSSGSIALGTPGTLSGSTTNSVTTSSHTHALSANLTAWDGVTVASKADSARTIAAGNGLSGGGTLAANRTISLGTPETLSGSTANSVSTSSHTHELEASVFAGRSNLGAVNLDSRSEESGYASVSTAANATVENNFPWNGGGGSLLNFTTGTSSSYRTQIFNNRNGSQIAFRARSGATAWTTWNEFWHSGNFTPGDYTLTSRTISAGNGLSGGGTLAANRTITLGTPGTITGSSTNAVQSSSHTHALTLVAGDIPNLAASQITSGSFAAARIPNLNASKITAGTFAAARIPDLSGSYVATSGNQTGIAGNKTFTGNITANALYGGSFRSSSGSADLAAASSNAGVRLMPNGYSTVGQTHIAGNGNMTVAGEITASGHSVFLNGGTAELRSSGNHLVMSVGGAGGIVYLRPNGDTSSSGQFTVNTSGNVTANGTVTATNLTATSDPRLKDDIKKVKARRELIEKLEYFSFKWKKDGVEGRSIMADKVQEIAPEHVHVGEEDGMLSVDKGALALEMVLALIDKLEAIDGSTN